MGRPYVHDDTDLEAEVGTPVFAMYDGTATVKSAADGNAGGNRIRIASDNGAEITRYMHLSRMNIQDGQHVTAGDKIGWTGITGNANPVNSGRNPHLHTAIDWGSPSDWRDGSAGKYLKVQR